jgi:hypothetical protein
MVNDSDFKGYITYRFTKLERNGNAAWLYASLLTLFTINLVGFPIMQRQVELGLEVAIFNKDGKLIKKYNSDKEKSAFSAMYWGYSMVGAASEDSYISTLQRAANAKAFSSSLSSILKQIISDLPNLQQQLK